MYVFTITFAWFVRADVHKTDFKAGLKNFYDSIEARYDNFSHLYSKSCDTLWFVKSAEAEGDVAPSNFSLRLPIGETFSREATATRGA